MENKRKVVIDVLHPEYNLAGLHNYLGCVLEKYPLSTVVSAYTMDYDGGNSWYVVTEVDKTEVDLQLEAAQNKLYKLPYQYHCNNVSTREVVISQDTPISEEVLEGIKNDGKNDKYWLHLNGCVLERYLTKPEIAKLQRKADKLRKKQLAEREPLEQELRDLRKLQYEQDEKYRMENL